MKKKEYKDTNEKVVLVLPVFNEGKSIYDLLGNLNKSISSNIQIIVIDDKSTDDSLIWIKKFLNENNELKVEVISHEKNLGLGGAINSGLYHCLNNLNFKVLITMDGDNTHNPLLIPKMISEIDSGKDIVIASRYRKGASVVGIPKFRMFLSFGARICYSIFWNYRGVRDYTCLYRAYSYDILKKAFPHANKSLLKEKGFLASTELLRVVFRSGAVVSELPIIINYSNKFEASSMKIFKTIFSTLRVLIIKN